MAVPDGPSAADLHAADALIALIDSDVAFVRLRQLMEVDWTAAAAVTVEEVGLVPLLQRQAARLRAAAGADRERWDALGQAIRYLERHDPAARTALWWLGKLAREPLLRGARS